MELQVFNHTFTFLNVSALLHAMQLKTQSSSQFNEFVFIPLRLAPTAGKGVGKAGRDLHASL